MQSLPFRKRDQVAELFRLIDTTDLVLICSKASEPDDYLLVYNTFTLPTVTHDGCRVKSLSKLSNSDYAEYDGLVVGFSVFDIIWSDIPTHGVNFYSIENLFKERDKQSELWDNSHNLARWILERLGNLSAPETQATYDRGIAKVIQLALPKFLAQSEIKELVGVSIDSSLEVFLNNASSSSKLIYLSQYFEFARAANSSQFFVGFDLPSKLRSNLPYKYPRALELRYILRQMGHHEAVRSTSLSLAAQIWKQAESSQSAELERSAYSLAAEAFLSSEDAHDLIAMFPSISFERFLKEGDALRVYLTPRLNPHLNGGQSSSRISIDEMLNSDPTQLGSSLAEYASLPITFPVLASVASRIADKEVLDLGAVLRNSGRIADLASIFLLLSRNLLVDRVRWQDSNIPAQEVSNLARRAALLCSLSDPWDPHKLPRYEIGLDNSYENLNACISHEYSLASGTPMSDYYDALYDWYSCHKSSNLQNRLNALHEHLRNFLVNTTTNPELEVQRVQAKKLRDTLDGFAFEGRMAASTDFFMPRKVPAVEIFDFLRAIANSNEEIPLLSSIFMQAYHEYHSLRERWHDMKNELHMQIPSADQLDQLGLQYRRLELAFHGPSHELEVLHLACRRDREEIKSLRGSLGLGPLPRLTILNPQILFQRREHLTIEIQNSGDATAQRFQLQLLPSQQYNIFPGNDNKIIDKFERAQLQYFEWDIAALEESISLVFRYRYQTQGGKEVVKEEAHPLAVIQSASRRLKATGAELYNAGTPVGGDLFKGRRDKIKVILRQLIGRTTSPILIRGPRRMGKTSIMRRIPWLFSRGTELSRLDISPNEQAFLRQFLTIEVDLGGYVTQPNFRRQIFEKAYLRAAKEARVEPDIVQVQKDFLDNHISAFQNYMNDLHKRKPEFRYLFMLDEWDEVLNEGPDPQRNLELRYLSKEFRSIWQNHDLMSFVNWLVTSTWTLSQSSRGFGSEFFSLFYPMEIGPLEWNAATELVIEPSKNLGVDWKGDAVVYALSQTARRPYLLQLLCSKVISLFDPSEISLVDIPVVTRAINQILTEPQSSSQTFGFLWRDTLSEGQARIRWLGRLILWIILKESPKPLSELEIRDKLKAEFKKSGRTLPASDYLDWEFREQVQELKHVFDAISGEKEGYSFAVPVAEAWFKREIAGLDVLSLCYKGLYQDAAEWKVREQQKTNPFGRSPNNGS